MRDWPCEGLGGLRNDASACRWVPIRRQPRAPFVGENGGDYGPHGSWSFPFLIYIVLNWGHRRLGPIYSTNEGSRLVYDVYSRPRRSCPQLRTIYINLRTTACVPYRIPPMCGGLIGPLTGGRHGAVIWGAGVRLYYACQPLTYSPTGPQLSGILPDPPHGGTSVGG